MDPFSIAPIAALLNVAYATVQTLAALFTPVAGTTAAAIAIVALTLLVRSALIPVGVSQVKAEWTRRRLAPKLQELQRRYHKNPQLLQQKTMELYKRENVSMFAGVLPALAQAPVLSLVYALFLRTTVDGQANELLTEHLLGTPLGGSFAHLVASGALWPGLATFGAIFAIMAATAWISRRIALRVAMPDARRPAGVRGSAQLASVRFGDLCRLCSAGSDPVPGDDDPVDADRAGDLAATVLADTSS